MSFLAQFYHFFARRISCLYDLVKRLATKCYMEKIKHLEPRALKRALGQSPVNQMKTFIPKKGQVIGTYLYNYN